MSPDLSLLSLVLHASAMVQLVLLILVAASVVSWAMIFDRARVFGKARRSANAFEERFWSGGDLSALYKDLSADNKAAQGLAAIFRAGFKEYVRLRKIDDIDLGAVLQGTERSMRVALSREMDRLEMNLSFLATVGSTSPYVGLFGTVWGIMHSFRGLANATQATLATVAPGISEALVATAMGLFAAIPAVLAYNRFASKVEVFSNRYDTFLDEFSSILYRQAYALRARDRKAG